MVVCSAPEKGRRREYGEVGEWRVWGRVRARGKLVMKSRLNFSISNLVRGGFPFAIRGSGSKAVSLGESELTDEDV